MSTFNNTKDGKKVLLAMVKAIQDNKVYLSDVDGLIGDGDHGVNMNKGFSIFEDRIKDRDISFSEGLDELGTILLTEIGGSMGPIYGTIFIEMAEAADSKETISLDDFSKMLGAGLSGLSDIVEAKIGDKTLVDTLAPAVDSLTKSIRENADFKEALTQMIIAAENGKESTKDLVAKYRRSSRLGERSRGVLDAGATSCCILLTAMANSMSCSMQS